MVRGSQKCLHLTTNGFLVPFALRRHCQMPSPFENTQDKLRVRTHKKINSVTRCFAICVALFQDNSVLGKKLDKFKDAIIQEVHCGFKICFWIEWQSSIKLFYYSAGNKYTTANAIIKNSTKESLRRDTRCVFQNAWY